MGALPRKVTAMLQAQTLAPTIQTKRKRRIKLDHLMAHLGLLLICVGFLLPFAWMVSTSLKSPSDTMAFPPTLIPKPVMWENYKTVITDERVDFPLFARNTLIVASLSVLGTTLSSAVAAYGFARIKFKGRGALFALMLSTMMIPFPVVMVSTFTLFRWMGDHTPLQMLGTFRPLWLPAWFGSAFNIFLLRQFFMTIPEELSESARLDGCSEVGIFLRIILPLARPALMVVALFSFMNAWNDFMGPLVYLQRPSQYTLSLGLQAYQSAHAGTEWNYLMGASVLVILPIIILYFLTQKTFVQGIATTGMKG
jgi:multiple sugar transport system permease protein